MSLLMLHSSIEGLDLIIEAIERAKYTGKVKIGMDVAASEFYTGDAEDSSHGDLDGKLQVLLLVHFCLLTSSLLLQRIRNIT